MRIRVVDLETTGLEPKDAAPCEIGWSDLVREGERWSVSDPHSKLLNPGHPIPPETSAVHHIVDGDLEGAQPWKTGLSTVIVRTDDVLYRLPDLVAYAAHNAKFEKQWCSDFSGDVPFICTYRCALRVWPDAPNHQNNTLRYWLKLPVERAKAEPTHRAGPDAYVTAFLLKALLNNASVEQLIQWSNEPGLQVRCQFGKHRGTLWKDVPADYLAWCERQKMDEDVAFTVATEIKRRAGRR